ncbi:MAG: NAD-dependent epimerase/dehydratase family protein [Gemmatimonadales bacterium]|nr:MAG: NAD-dependent epimerase/dehydratase family protein [Gemmatimonadales bacterium]
MTDPSTVLIAGCGYVGTRLGLDLADAGHYAVGLRRSPSELPAGIRPLTADLTSPELPEALSAAGPFQQVVYATAADGGTPEAYHRAYVEGLENLIAALETGAHPVSRLLFVSSTGVYGDHGGGEVDESTPTAPESFRGAVMVEAESVALSAPWPSAALRLGGIYGPGRTRILDRVRAGEARFTSGPPIWSNRIHRDDAAGALAHLLALPAEELDPVWLGVDAEPVPLREIYRWLARRLDAPEPREDPSLRRDRSNKRCISRKLQESGYEFLYPSFREGYGEMIEAEEHAG